MSGNWTDEITVPGRPEPQEVPTGSRRYLPSGPSSWCPRWKCRSAIRTLAGCSVDWPFSSQLQNRPQVVDKLRRNRSHIDGRTR